MSRIESFSIQGLAGRRKPVAYELQNDVNIFFGLNGSGKTTLLKILFSALRNEPRMLDNLPFRSASVTFYSHNRNKRYTRTIKMGDAPEEEAGFELVEMNGTFVEIKSESPVVPDAEWKTTPQNDRRYGGSFLTTARLTGEISSYQGTRITTPGTRRVDEAQLDQVFASYVSSMWRNYTNSALSQVRVIQQAGLAGILQILFQDADATGSGEGNPGRTLDSKVAYKRAREFLGRQGVTSLGTSSSFYQRYNSDARLRQVVERIDQVERQIEIVEQARSELQKLVQEFLGEGKTVEFADAEIRVRSGEEVIPLRSLSSGEKQLLRIMVEVVTLDTAVVIIDEPELSMHIDWQHRLIRSLRVLSPSSQIIVATHSPEIMADLPDANIFRV